MSDKTALGNRMKFYEKEQTPTRFMPHAPVCARIDGKNFSRFTKDLERPFDARLTKLMVLTTHHLVKETNACIGYTQSDEISLIWFTDDSRSQIFMDGKRDKMNSLLAAMTTSYFNLHLNEHLAEKAATCLETGNCPIFDARVWQVPTKQEAANYLMWREHDATKNSVSAAAQQHFSHNALHEKNGSEMQDMLHTVGVNWNNYPSSFKRGTYVQRREAITTFSSSELENLPKHHDARLNHDLAVLRHCVKTVTMPKCNSIANYIDAIFDGAEPILKQ